MRKAFHDIAQIYSLLEREDSVLEVFCLHFRRLLSPPLLAMAVDGALEMIRRERQAEHRSERPTSLIDLIDLLRSLRFYDEFHGRLLEDTSKFYCEASEASEGLKEHLALTEQRVAAERRRGEIYGFDPLEPLQFYSEAFQICSKMS